MDPDKRITMAQYLELPAGWTAERFPATVELTGPNGKRTGIPFPYNPMPHAEWIAAAKAAIAEAEGASKESFSRSPRSG